MKKFPNRKPGRPPKNKGWNPNHTFVARAVKRYLKSGRKITKLGGPGNDINSPYKSELIGHGCLEFENPIYGG